jgi:hypothetical protein
MKALSAFKIQRSMVALPSPEYGHTVLLNTLGQEITNKNRLQVSAMHRLQTLNEYLVCGGFYHHDEENMQHEYSMTWGARHLRTITRRLL